MKITFSAIVTLFFVNAFFAQIAGDTVFYNKNNKITSRDSMYFYRLMQKRGDLFLVEDYYRSDKPKMTGSYTSLDPEVKSGKFTYYLETSGLEEEYHYKDNQKDGAYNLYYPSGKLRLKSYYSNNQLEGITTGYFESGIIKREEVYSAGKMDKGVCYNEKGKKVNYYPFEEPATYKGGVQEMKLFLAQNMRYPNSAIEDNLEGKAYLRFVIDTKGKVTNVRVLRGVADCPECDREAIRVIKAMPAWNPGKIDGELVNSYFDLPVTFRLQ